MSTKLNYGLSSNEFHGSNQLYLKVFEDHPLFEPSFIYVAILEDILKYNKMSFKIYVNYWDKEGVHKTRDKRISGQDLLEFSPEIQEFTRTHYPQHSL